MKKKSIFVTICCILSAVLFISIFVLTSFVKKQSTKIVGSSEIYSGEYESGQSDEYLFVYGSDTVNGEINWLLESADPEDPVQDAAFNNISYKKVAGSKAVITWNDELEQGKYNLILRAAVKDQSLKNARLNITLNIAVLPLTIVGKTTIFDIESPTSINATSTFASEPFRLFDDEVEVINDSKYTWVVLVGVPDIAIPGEYTWVYNENISVTYDHRILWNKNVSNGVYHLKLRVLDQKSYTEIEITLTINRQSINLKYNGAEIVNNTIPDITSTKDSLICESGVFTAYRGGTPAENVLWTLDVVSSNSQTEKDKIFFANDGKIKWAADLLHGEYNLELHASTYEDLDSPIISFKIIVSTVTLSMQYFNGTSWVGMTNQAANLGNRALSNAPGIPGNYVTGASPYQYRMNINNDPLNEIWTISSSGGSYTDPVDGSFYFLSDYGQRLKYTGDSTGDIWYDVTDRRIHWKVYPTTVTADFPKLYMFAKLSPTAYPNYDRTSSFTVRFGVGWGNANPSIYDNEGNVSSPSPITIKNPDTDATTFTGSGIEINNAEYFNDANYTSMENSYNFMMVINNYSNESLEDDVYYEVSEERISDDEGRTWNTIPDTDYAENGIVFSNPSFQFYALTWKYSLSPLSHVLLKLSLVNNDQTVTCYSGDFWISIKFEYDYIKTTSTSNPIIPLSGNNQPMEFYYSKNNLTNDPLTACASTANWYYYSYPIPATSSNPAVLSGWQSIVRSTITEIYLHTLPLKFESPTVFYSDVTSVPSTTWNGQTISYYDQNLFTNFLSGCSSLKKAYISMPTTGNIYRMGSSSTNLTANNSMHIGETIQLQKNDYASMFWGCSSLTDVIFEQPSEETFCIRYTPTSTYEDCSNVYRNMFRGCTNLERIKFSFAGSYAYAKYNLGNYPAIKQIYHPTTVPTTVNEWMNINYLYLYNYLHEYNNTDPDFSMNNANWGDIIDGWYYSRRDIQRWISNAKKLDTCFTDMFNGCKKLVPGDKFVPTDFKRTVDDPNNSYFIPSRYKTNTTNGQTSTNMYLGMFTFVGDGITDPARNFVTVNNNNNTDGTNNPDRYGQMNTSSNNIPYFNSGDNTLDIQAKMYLYPITFRAPDRSIFPFLVN